MFHFSSVTALGTMYAVPGKVIHQYITFSSGWGWGLVVVCIVVRPPLRNFFAASHSSSLTNNISSKFGCSRGRAMVPAESRKSQAESLKSHARVTQESSNRVEQTNNPGGPGGLPCRQGCAVVRLGWVQKPKGKKIASACEFESASKISKKFSSVTPIQIFKICSPVYLPGRVARL
jgi:hypothetical protein